MVVINRYGGTVLTCKRPFTPDQVRTVLQEVRRLRYQLGWAPNQRIRNDFSKLLNEENKAIEDSLIKPGHLAEMLMLIDKGTISGKIAKTVFEEMYRTGKDAGTVVKEKGLVQVSNESELEKIVDDIISSSPGEVERFKGGDAKLMGFFVGQVMKATKGKANPKVVNELLRKKLG